MKTKWKSACVAFSFSPSVSFFWLSSVSFISVSSVSLCSHVRAFHFTHGQFRESKSLTSWLADSEAEDIAWQLCGIQQRGQQIYNSSKANVSGKKCQEIELNWEHSQVGERQNLSFIEGILKVRNKNNTNFKSSFFLCTEV